MALQGVVNGCNDLQVTTYTIVQNEYLFVTPTSAGGHGFCYRPDQRMHAHIPL
ncbi:MAG: hypothetical protein H5T69_06060 [Chloroflexi bacterium]|nr:hypothetical protein [Chloroflexota bacterium]